MGAWLAENASRGHGVWFVSWKRGTGRSALTYEEAVEEVASFAARGERAFAPRP